MQAPSGSAGDKGTERMYWLIAVPNTKPGIFEQHQKRTEKESQLCANYHFPVASQLRVGTLDTLMSLSDDLQKIDLFVETTVRKIARHFLELVEKAEPMVKNATSEAYLQQFKWDEAKYPSKNTIKELTQQISAEVSKLDEELRVRTNEYSSIIQAIAAAERKATLLARSINDLIKPEDFLDTEHLTTLFIVIPKHSQKEWELCYEKLTDNVVPRSSVMLSTDQEHTLLSVKLFKKVADDFKHIVREKKWVVRDFTAAEVGAASSESDRKKLETDKEELARKLTMWCKVNFGEAFVAWTHLKCIRLFVESVLRYGLPVNFLAILMKLHKKGNDYRLRAELAKLYANLGSAGGGDAPEAGGEEFYPYVYLPLDLTWAK